MACSRGCCATPREHYLSVSVSALATPTRRPRVTEVENTEARWQQDIPAYKRMRKSGLQPRTVDGASQVERDMGG